MREINFALSWYLTVIITFSFALLLLINSSFPRVVVVKNFSSYQFYRTLPAVANSPTTLEINIQKNDARPVLDLTNPAP